ncbi:MAG TPA: bifunctional methylenetetrahydrofolate dehydrogenase/methenyltetrahydrofolate cyclohydrolase FolD [Parachlamydiaceae bacterium]|nr:bifunctional methylenetetrahydrofolate dehydrogenase/methenyltetrahydrofolate cyclohydrolase FolD [Parachlamydiaceae bacterium]
MLIDGKAIAEEIQKELKLFLDKQKGPKPCLAVIIVGDHPPSLIYVNRKTQACAEIGIESIRIALPSDISEEMLIAEIEKLNQNKKVNGILLQLPLPPQINPINILNHISPEKDVDGLHPVNVGKMLIGDKNAFFPCTPHGIKVLLERSNVDVAGKHVLVLGRSNLVGKPMAAILMQNAPGANATVTIAHSRTLNIKNLCLTADIIIAAIGHPKFVTADMVREGTVIIDVGINKIADASQKNGYKIVGDVDFENVKDKCSLITPVPGGVGPMTIAMLLSNTVKSYRRSHP